MSREIDFENTIKSTLESIKELLIVKGKEYRRKNNPYHNFEVGAEKTGQSRIEVLRGFALKHSISIDDMIEDLENRMHPSIEKVNEKYNDLITYLLIEKSMMIEYCLTKK
jgi:hypothetical protein